MLSAGYIVMRYSRNRVVGLAVAFLTAVLMLEVSGVGEQFGVSSASAIGMAVLVIGVLWLVVS